MYIKSRFFHIAQLLLLTIASHNATAEITIISNAIIYTVDTDKPRVEAFAYENDTIIAVGKLKALSNQFARASTIDLKGATVVPGLIDSHAHLLDLGLSLMNVDLVGTVDKAEIIERLVDFSDDLPKGEWLIGRGWDQNDWPIKELPSAKDLNKAFPNRPVWIERIDGHAGWANRVAMELVSKNLAGTWQPDGGKILRDNHGFPTGMFIDNAVLLIDDIVPKKTHSKLEEALQRALQKTASVGLTGVHDAETDKNFWDLLQNFKDHGKLTLRVYSMADDVGDMYEYLCENGTIIDPEALLTARSLKLYSDGALGSKGAALLEPYSDNPDQTGLLIETPETLSQHAKDGADCGLQVNIHAIGDRGNRLSLDALEGANNATNPGRHRIEHSQIVEESDFVRFKELNIIASVQPTHATSDMYWAEDRLGSERIKGGYAWQKFIALGIPLALGSDFPIERPEPLEGFYASISRQDAKGYPEGGWFPDQRLSREQALYGFTKGAAYAAFQEDIIGSIEVGKKADFVVLSQDIMTVPVEQILETKVLSTYLNGKLIYQSSPLSEIEH